jgi:A/G-specific adenine glycosylase
VLAAWSGLGYYRRARSLHRAAQQIVGRHGGRLPRTVPELRALPGIGRYTSAAVASIAFGVPVAVVDGNVERVISRLLAANGQSADYWALAESLPREPSAGRLASSTLDYWALAESLLERSRPGDWNQAMMELGATVCLPRVPQCGACPLKRWCNSSPKPGSLSACWGGKPGSPATAAFAVAGVEKPGSPTSPLSACWGGKPGGKRQFARVGSPPPRQKCHKDEAYLLAQRRRSVYLVRRAARAKVMPGMWELPRLPLPPAGREPLFRVKHSITVTDYDVAVFDAAGKPGGGRWVALQRLPELPLTGLARKVLRRARLI